MLLKNGYFQKATLTSKYLVPMRRLITNSLAREYMKNNFACQGNIVSNMTQYDVNEKGRLLSLLTQDSTVSLRVVYLSALHNG